MLSEEVRKYAEELPIEVDLESFLREEKGIRLYRISLGKRKFEVYTKQQEVYIVPVTGSDPTVQELRLIFKMLEGVAR